MFTLPKSIVIFDLETTDAYVQPVEIVEIGAVKLDRNFGIVRKFNTLVKPTNMENFTECLQGMTGITVAELEQAPTFKDAWRPFADFTEWNKTMLGAWGANYDFEILRGEYERANCTCPHGVQIDVKSIALFEMYAEGMRPRKQSLAGICKRLEIDYDEDKLHRALYDAELTTSVLQSVALTRDEL